MKVFFNSQADKEQLKKKKALHCITWSIKTRNGEGNVALRGNWL